MKEIYWVRCVKWQAVFTWDQDSEYIRCIKIRDQKIPGTSVYNCTSSDIIGG